MANYHNWHRRKSGLQLHRHKATWSTKIQISYWIQKQFLP